MSYWATAPYGTRGQRDGLLRDLRALLEPNLAGLYLHGSLAMGCFNPSVLNLCRVYLYLLEGRISSKDEAGVWATHTLPRGLRPVVEQGLALYHSAGTDDGFAPADLDLFAHYVDERVSALVVARNGRQ